MEGPNLKSMEIMVGPDFCFFAGGLLTEIKFHCNLENQAWATSNMILWDSEKYILVSSTSAWELAPETL